MADIKNRPSFGPAQCRLSVPPAVCCNRCKVELKDFYYCSNPDLFSSLFIRLKKPVQRIQTLGGFELGIFEKEVGMLTNRLPSHPRTKSKGCLLSFSVKKLVQYVSFFCFFLSMMSCILNENFSLSIVPIFSSDFGLNPIELMCSFIRSLFKHYLIGINAYYLRQP